MQIPKALWAYRTSVRTPIGATPFSLVYGTEAILPIELKIPSLRINLSEQISDEKIRQTRLDQLLLLDEKRINALEHMRVYQERIKRAFDKKALIREFKIGDLVLKENQQTSRIE